MTRKRLILLGAGDFAREVLWIAGQIPYDQRDWDIHGLLDDNPDAAKAQLERYGVSYPVVGTIADHRPEEDQCFIPAIGSAKGKLAVCEVIRRRGGAFTDVIHPTAIVAPNVSMGQGILLFPHALVSVNVRLGSFVTFLVSAVAGHDAVIDDGVTVCAHCDVNGHAHIERGVFLGSQAVVLPGARVCEFATVGAGSVVLRKVPAGQTVFGVPAKGI